MLLKKKSPPQGDIGRAAELECSRSPSEDAQASEQHQKSLHSGAYRATISPR